MEKIIPVKIIDTGRKTKEGKPVIEIETQDGRKGSAFDSLFLGLTINQEFECEVKEGKEYNGVKQLYFTLKSDKPAVGKFPAKDWAYDKRKNSLEIAVQAISKTDKQITSENILALAEKFFEYLNKK